MRKIFLTFIVLTFAHIVFAQNKQTIVVRPETAREKEKRKMNDALETFQMLGEFGKLMKEGDAIFLNRVKNSKYSLYVEEKLEDWKKKGEFEKTADWQKRLNDSTAIKKAEIIESFSADEYARALYVYEYLESFYDTKGQYDADKEALVVKTFWGNIPIPIPLDKAKNWHDIQKVGALEAHFFIQNDQLALLSLSKTYDDETYTWENPSPAATNILQKERQKERERLVELKRRNEEVRLAVEELREGQEPKPLEEGVEEYRAIEEEDIFTNAEQMPQFPGGDKEMMNYLSNNMKYPTIAQEQGIQGTVVIRFVVGKTGKIRDIAVVRSLEPSCDKEAIRVIKSMPQWISGRQNGKPVNVYYTLPVRFRLAN